MGPCPMLNPDQHMEKAESHTYWSHTTWARPLIRKSVHLWANHPQHWVTVHKGHLWNPRNPMRGPRITGWVRLEETTVGHLAQSPFSGLSQSTRRRIGSRWFLTISTEVFTVLQGTMHRNSFGGYRLWLYFWELCSMHLQWFFLICQAFKWEICFPCLSH